MKKGKTEMAVGRIMAVIILFVLALVQGCGGGTSTTGTAQNNSNAKGLAIQLDFKTGKTASKTLQSLPAQADVISEIKKRITTAEVQITTESGHFINSYEYDAPNGVIQGSTPLHLNVGRYNLQVITYTKGHIILALGQAVAEVTTEGGTVIVEMNPTIAFTGYFQINQMPGSWYLSSSQGNSTYYDILTGTTSANGVPLGDYYPWGQLYLNFDPADPLTKPSLHFSSPIYLLSPETEEYDPTVKLFFRVEDSNGKLFWEEYPVDVWQIIDAADNNQSVEFDYNPTQGNLSVEVS